MGVCIPKGRKRTQTLNSKKSQPAAIYEKLQVSLENQLDLHRFSYHEKCIHLSTMRFVLGMIKTFTDQWVRQKKTNKQWNVINALLEEWAHVGGAANLMRECVSEEVMLALPLVSRP